MISIAVSSYSWAAARWLFSTGVLCQRSLMQLKILSIVSTLSFSWAKTSYHWIKHNSIHPGSESTIRSLLMLPFHVSVGPPSIKNRYCYKHQRFCKRHRNYSLHSIIVKHMVFTFNHHRVKYSARRAVKTFQMAQSSGQSSVFLFVVRLLRIAPCHSVWDVRVF